MNKEKKDALGYHFILNKEMQKEELNNIEIQGILFLINSAQYFINKGIYGEYDLQGKIAAFKEALINKIKTCTKLYIIYDVNTDYPFINSEDKVLLFSEHEYADEIAYRYRRNKVYLNIKELRDDEILNMFKLFHILGIKDILLDMGQYEKVINRDEIVPPESYDDVDDINVPITNPIIQHDLIRFFQCLYNKREKRDYDIVLASFEQNMIKSLLQGKYLLPLFKGADENNITYPRVKVKDEEYIPIFTDWYEFSKVYDKAQFKATVINYDIICSLIAKSNGIILNNNGVHFTFTNRSIQNIQRFKESQF